MNCETEIIWPPVSCEAVRDPGAWRSGGGCGIILVGDWRKGWGRGYFCSRTAQTPGLEVTARSTRCGEGCSRPGKNDIDPLRDEFVWIVSLYRSLLQSEN